MCHAISGGIWTDVEISQLLLNDGTYQFSIFVGDVLFSQMVNEDAREFENVKIWFGDNFYDPAPARIDDFKFEPIGKL